MVELLNVRLYFLFRDFEHPLCASYSTPVLATDPLIDSGYAKSADDFALFVAFLRRPESVLDKY